MLSIFLIAFIVILGSWLLLRLWFWSILSHIGLEIVSQNDDKGKYFKKIGNNIDHQLLMTKLSSEIPCRRTLGLIKRIITAHGKQGKGLILGSLLSPLLSNVYLNRFDHAMRRYAHLVRYIGPELVYGIHFSAVPMIFAICGGRFTILGSALAALVLYPLDQFVFHPLFPAGHEFLYGLVLILAILFAPSSGVWGSLRRAS